jgi:N-acetylglucosaminyl-diphospho-decaprenol L-rhamnosyltransferase
VPWAEVVHVEGASSGQDPAARARRFHAGRLAYVRKWHGRRLAAALRGYLLVESLGRGLEEGAKLALGSRPGVRRARLREISSLVQCAARG